MELQTTTPLIDTHAHSYDEQFCPDLNSALERAFAAGVGQIWLPNCNSETIPGMMALEERYPNRCLPMMGLHPTYVNADFEGELAIVENWLAKRPFLAVGEIGLDFYWDVTYAEEQIAAFRRQLCLASQYHLPVSIHCRSGNGLNAFSQTADLIDQHGDPQLRGIFHCFVGTLDEARRAIGLNFLLGIGGVVTFKNGGLNHVLPHVGLDHLVLETDAPYLAPVPFRGKRNESAYLPLIARRVADLKQVSLDEVIRQTTENARRLTVPPTVLPD